MHRFEQPQSRETQRRTSRDEDAIELSANSEHLDRWTRKTQSWFLLFTFAVHFTVMRLTLREFPFWVYVPMLAIWLSYFVTLRYDLGRRLGARLPGAKARAERRAQQMARVVIRLDPRGVHSRYSEKMQHSVAWSEILRVEARRGMIVGVDLHLRSGKRVTLSSIGFTETPQALAEIVEASRQRWG